MKRPSRWLMIGVGSLLVVAFGGVLLLAIDLYRQDQPIATIRVLHDANVELSDEIALTLTAAALDRIDFVVVEAIPFRVNPDEYVARNALHPDDRLYVIYSVAGERHDDYVVTLERDQQGIVATVNASWK